MLGSKKSAPKPLVHFQPVVQTKRQQKPEPPIDISKILSVPHPRRRSTSRQEREMARALDLELEHEFTSDTPYSVDSTPPSRKRKAFGFDTDSEDLSDNAESPSLASFSFSPKETNGMIGSAMNVEEEEFSFVGQNSESDYFSDSDNPVSKKAKLSSVDSSSPAFPLQDNRSFARFMKDEKLVEVVRDWDTYPIGSICEIKANGELWIAGEKTHVVISKATQDEMKKQKLWGQRMKIVRFGYVQIGSGIVLLHNKLAKSKKDRDFHDLLDAGWVGRKDELVVLHLNDCPFDFNIDNLKWHSQEVNMLMKKSKGRKKSQKFRCSTNINGHKEETWSVSSLAEARHSVDVLKINNVSKLDRDIVYNYGLNYTYPSIEILLARSHLYKTVPSYQGNLFKSKGTCTLIDWKHADEGLKKAVEDSCFPFDSTYDVLVFYEGYTGVFFMFVMERDCFNAHFLDEEVTCRLGIGYVLLNKQDLNISLHRLVLGLEARDGKVGRHRTDHFDGRRDNRLRLLRSGTHRNNAGDRDQKTSTSTSVHQGVSWNKKSQRYKAAIRFSNSFCRYKKELGLFGIKGKKDTGADEAAEWRNKVKAHVDRINEQFRDIQDLVEFKKSVDREVKKLK